MIPIWPSVSIVGGSSEVMNVDIILNFNEVTVIDVLAYELMPVCSMPTKVPFHRPTPFQKAFPSSL